MQITIDLARIQDAPDLARASVLAVLCAMPEDEVRLLAKQWEACQAAALRADEEAWIDLRPSAPPAAAAPEAPQAEAVGIDAPADDAAPADVPRETIQGTTGFEFMGYTYSPARRGPSAAVKKALEVVERCATAADLDRHRPALAALAAWLVEVDRTDKATELTTAVAAAAERGRAGEEQPREPAPEGVPLDRPAAPADAAAPVEAAGGNGAGLASLSLKALCRHVEEQVGGGKVFEAIGRRKVRDIPEAERAAARAAVMGLLEVS